MQQSGMRRSALHKWRGKIQMTAVIIGSIGFLCCFLYDHNSIRLKKSFLHPFFSIGCFLIAVSTGLVIRSCWPRRGSSFFISGSSAPVSGTVDLYIVFCAALWWDICQRKSWKAGLYRGCLCTLPTSWRSVVRRILFLPGRISGIREGTWGFWGPYRVEHIVHFLPGQDRVSGNIQ